ncbi:MAG: glycosyltransferase family 39 protein [Isosphaeraceae bacterium]|nr:glycosyltransferase family 39 protein [Isosphaeraceae bacterium]
MLVGCLWTIALNGTVGLAGYGVARYGLRQPPGLPRLLAAFVLAWVWATLGLEVLGTLGLLARLPLLLWSGAGLGAAALFWRRDRSPEPLLTAAAPAAWETESVVALGLALWAAGLFGADSLLYPVKVVSDGPIYHLYFAARWWKAERLFLIAAPFGETAATYFPAVGDLWFTWLMAGWGGDRLAKIGQVPFLIVSSLAAYALARRLGAGRSAALLAVIWFATSTPLILFAFEPNVDTIFAAGYLLAAYFLMRDALGDDDGPSLALGALAAGCALGAKAIGVVFVPVLLALAALGLIARRRGRRRTVLGLLALALLPMVTAGYWYGRNLALTGNPLYPLRVEVAGRVWLTGWYASGAMRQSVYYLPVSLWGACADHLLAVVDPRFAPLWVASLAGAWAWGRRQAAADRPMIWACAALAVVNIGLFWFLIAYRTQQRFMYPALGLSVAPLAATLDRGRWLRVTAAVLLALHLLTPQAWPFVTEGDSVPWDLCDLIPNGVGAPVPLPSNGSKLLRAWAQPKTRTALGAMLLVGVGAIGVAWAWSQATRPRDTRARQVRAWLATAAWAAVVLGLNSAPQVESARTFFPAFPDYRQGWLQFDARSGPTGARVAYAGTDLPYYLLGAGLRNEVRYVNVDAHRDWLMHDYHRAAGYPAWPGPRPGWDRLHPDYDAWLANLRAERIQLLVVTRANPNEGRHNIADREGFPIERVWADAHPETFEPLYGEVERDPRFRLYRVRPPDRQGGPSS